MSIKAKIHLISFLLFLPSVLLAQLDLLDKGSKTLSKAEDVVADAGNIIANINTDFDRIRNDKLYKSLIDGKEFSFPVGILPADGSENYALAINGVYMTPEGLFAKISMRIPVGQGRSLFFYADKVPFSRSGGIAGELNLYLLRSDSISVGDGFDIKFDGLESAGADNACRVTFSCKGFSALTLAGAVNFNKKTLINSETKEAVSIKFLTRADKVANLQLRLKGIPVIEFSNLPGYRVTVPEIYVDKSEIDNMNIPFPASYRNLSPGFVDSPHWEGVYVPFLKIEIPKYVNEEADTSFSLVSEHLIIDQNGVTSFNTLKPAFSGGVKGWDYSLDSIKLNLLANSLSGAGLFGQITLPICKKDSRLAFSLLISKSAGSEDLTYLGSAKLNQGDLLNVSAFGVASMSLNSVGIQFEYSNKQFYPSATLSGTLAIAPKKDSTGASKTVGNLGIEFKDLIIGSREPYISVREIKTSSSKSVFANFPVSMSNFQIKNDEGGQKLGISMTLSLNLQKSDGSGSGGNGFGGSGGFTVWTERNPATKKWQYVGFDLDKIGILVDQGAFYLRGELEIFENDKVYGTGFCGYLNMKVLKKIEIKASAIFGRKNQIAINPFEPLADDLLDDKPGDAYRYWFVDAAVNFPVIPVASFVGINGFNGGLYHNMALRKNQTPPASDVVCTTASGMFYEPNDSVHLGLMAGVGLQAVPTAAVFYGTITLGLEFNKPANGGGLRMVALYGDATVLSGQYSSPGTSQLKDKMEVSKEIKPAPKPKAIPDNALTVSWFTSYDVGNQTFIGDFDIYVKYNGVVNGGANDEGLAGHIAVLFSPSANYVYLGTPLSPISLEVFNLFKATSYFCAGNVLPTPPIAPLPEGIASDLPNTSSLETGAGLTFGARVEISKRFSGTADFAGCSVGPFADVWAKAGFDLLISKSNEPVYCTSDQPRGINNWYATGQAFIAGGFELGVEYDCWGLGSGNKTLVSAGLSAYLFAQLPKPSYLKGAVTVWFEILEIRGKATVKLELGDQCSKSDLDKNIVFISSILPGNGSTDVRVSEKIHIAFSKELEKFNFYLPNESSSSSVLYRGFLDTTKHVIVRRSNGQIIPFSYRWNTEDSKTALVLTPLTVMPESDSITVQVTVEIQYKSGNNWIKSSQEVKTVYFKTGSEPYAISAGQVHYAYPLPNMKNYYRKEYNKGYIKLSTLPTKPFVITPGWDYQVIFLKGGTEVARATNVTVNNAVNGEQFVFDLPNDKLQDATTYTLKLVKASLANKHELEKTDPQKDITLGYASPLDADTTILQYNFTTSKYSSFAQKVASFNVATTDISGFSVVQTLAASSKDVDMEEFVKEETIGFEQEGNKINMLVQAISADFNNGIVIKGSGVPDTVTYSYYGGKLVINYNVFADMHKRLEDSNLDDIVCNTNINELECTAGTGTTEFPTGNYSYKLGYFLPGRNIKTSEVSRSFYLAQPITVGL